MSAPTTGPQLHREMGFVDLLLFVVITSFGIMWFAKAGEAGPAGVTFWALGGLVFYLPLALSVIVLADRYPGEGGLYLWSRRSFGDFAGFLTGWAYWTCILPFLPSVLYFIAGSALFVGGTRWQRLAEDRAYFIVASLVCLAVATAVNVAGLRVGKWLHNAGAIGTWVPALLLSVLAVVAWAGHGAATDLTASQFVPGLGWKEAALWPVLVMSLTGLEAAAVLGGEIKEKPARFKLTDKGLASLREEGAPEAVVDKLQAMKEKEPAPREQFLPELLRVLGPEDLQRWQASILNHAKKETTRYLPLALVIAAVLVIVTKVVGTLAILVALPAEELSGSGGFMRAFERAANRAGVTGLLPLVALLVVVGHVGKVGAWSATGARLPMVAGLDRNLPAAFGRIHPRWGSPYVALLFQAAVVAALVVIGQAGTDVTGAYDVFLSMTLIPTFVPFGFIFAAAIKALWSKPGPGWMHTPFGRWSALVCAGLGLLTTVASTGLAVIPPLAEPNPVLYISKVVGVAALVLGAGVLVYRLGK